MLTSLDEKAAPLSFEHMCGDEMQELVPPPPEPRGRRHDGVGEHGVLSLSLLLISGGAIDFFRKIVQYRNVVVFPPPAARNGRSFLGSWLSTLVRLRGQTSQASILHIGISMLISCPPEEGEGVVNVKTLHPLC